MRIEKISFKNINSLKGDHIVDFSKEPLREAGIFAIIGPTGSGKSTLLDVITLALFNRIPRFSKAISKNEIEGNGSVMTHYTDSAYASIEYTTSKGSYISEWKVDRARTGTLKDHEMHIFDKQDGKYLDLKKSEVPSMNEELIGLNYDQFAKSIILSQGQFSKFLKAGKNERGILLEKITGTEIYRKIGSRVYDKYVQTKKGIENQESSFEFIEILKEAERVSIEEQLQRSTNEIKTIEQSINKLSETIKIKQQISDLQKQKEITTQSKLDLLQQKINIEINISKLVQYENINPLRGDIALYTEAKKKQDLLEQQKIDINKEIDTNAKELEKVIASMSQLVNSEVSEDNFIKVMQAFEKEINQLFFEKNVVIKEGTDIRSKINSKHQAINYAIAAELENEKNPDRCLQLIENRTATINEKLNLANLTLKSHTNDITEQIKVKNNTSKSISDILSRSKELEKINIEHKDCSEKEVALNKSLSLTTPQLSEKKIQLNKLKVHLKNTQKNKEDSLALFKLNDYRANLVDGKECPLCGSKEHPLAGHTEKEDSHFDVEIKKTELGISTEEKEIQQLDQLIVKATTQLKSQSEQKAKLEKQKEELHNWFTQKNTNPQEQSNLENKLKIIDNEIELLNSCREALDEYKWLNDIKTEFSSLSVVGQKYSQLNSSIKEKYSGSDVSSDCNRLQDEFTKFSEGLKTDRQSLKMIDQDLKLEVIKIAELEGLLAPKIKALGFEKIEDVKQSFLTEEQVLKLKTEKENYDNKSIRLDTELKTITNSLSQLEMNDKCAEQTLEEIQNKLKIDEEQRNTLLKANGANQNKITIDDKNQKKLKTLNANLDKQKVELEKWDTLNRMIGDRTGSKFSNYAQNITLQTLLVHANRRMQNLYSRYLLSMPKSEGELIVIDTYQGNTERAVSTLSGGETFMVSLALALSLSDMASKNVALESLFIDEGFSTLDPEMLDLAMNTLDKIQSESQKTVGIISHVESLKERIAVQIQLERNAQGFSSIQIVS